MEMYKWEDDDVMGGWFIGMRDERVGLLDVAYCLCRFVYEGKSPTVARMPSGLKMRMI